MQSNRQPRPPMFIVARVVDGEIVVAEDPTQPAGFGSVAFATPAEAERFRVKLARSRAEPPDDWSVVTCRPKMIDRREGN